MSSETRVPSQYQLSCPQCGAAVETIVWNDPPDIELWGGAMVVMVPVAEVTGKPCNHRINGAKLRRTDGKPVDTPPALNPECQQGKHDNCDGQALHPDDSIGPCECSHHLVAD